MLIVENMAAIVALVMCLVCFALGYALRNWADEARADFERAFTYRGKGADDGRR